MTRFIAATFLVLAACGHSDMPDTREGIVRWARNCGNQLLVDVRDWYDGLPSGLSSERVDIEVQAMFVGAGRFKTTQVVLDRAGVPVGVTWDQRFWDSAGRVMPEAEVRIWKVWSASVLNSAMVSAGLYAPKDWRDASAKPVVDAISQTSGMGPDAAIAALNRLVPLPWDGYCVEQLKTLMPKFPERRFFPKTPEDSK
ncbi:MAG: hypothetical protein GY894_03045 [Planctomycetes bacterium]|jgi:hypothetical protein|nr:hypothetical protein [Planctomycetota bacterium]MCP4838327.1 hypothetical protein [Planctomycetota bacterium]